MAFITCKEHRFALAETYRGPAGVLEFGFQAVIPGGCDTIGGALQTALFSAGILPTIKDNYIGFRIDKEVVAGAPDRYRVLLWVAGEVTPASGVLDQILSPADLVHPQVALIMPVVIIISIVAGLLFLTLPIPWSTTNETFLGRLARETGAGLGSFFSSLFGPAWPLFVGGAVIVGALLLRKR